MAACTRTVTLKCTARKSMKIVGYETVFAKLIQTQCEWGGEVHVNDQLVFGDFRNRSLLIVIFNIHHDSAFHAWTMRPNIGFSNHHVAGIVKVNDGIMSPHIKCGDI